MKYNYGPCGGLHLLWDFTLCGSQPRCSNISRPESPPLLRTARHALRLSVGVLGVQVQDGDLATQKQQARNPGGLTLGVNFAKLLPQN